jgi:hypothetical protein
MGKLPITHFNKLIEHFQASLNTLEEGEVGAYGFSFFRSGATQLIIASVEHKRSGE